MGVEINNLRIKDIKKRLKEIEKLESERDQQSKPKNDKNKEAEKTSNPPSDTEANEGEGKDDKSAKDEKSDNGEKTEKDEKAEKEDNSEKDDSDSDTESKSKTTKNNPVSDNESKPQSTKSKSVKFNNDDPHDSHSERSKHDSAKDDKSESNDSTTELDPIQTEKRKLEADLEKYSNYGYNETHNEIMNFLEVHDPQKYRLRAKGVRVIAFFMKGKYGQTRISQTQNNQYSQNSNDGDNLDSKLAKRKKVIDKEKLEKLRQYKVKSRNAAVPEMKMNTMSPTQMKGGKLQANLLKQNKTKIGLRAKEEKEGPKVTLEILQQMNLKEFNQNAQRYDDFKPKDIMNDGDMMDDDNSVFNYFSPKSNAKKAKIKKTTTNKFVVKKAVIKEPSLDKVNENDLENYYTDDAKTGGILKSRKSKAGNLTSRVSTKDSKQKNSINNSRRSNSKGRNTARSGKKSASRSKSKAKSKSKSKSKGPADNKSKILSQKEKMLKRAAQIDKQNKKNEAVAMNKVLKMHDQKVASSLKVLTKRK